MKNELEQLQKKLDKIFELISNDTSNIPKHDFTIKEWMTLNEGAKYANVSINTFRNFRLHGLKVTEIEGIKLVSRKEIDSFLESNGY